MSAATQIGASTKILRGRGISASTQTLQYGIEAILLRLQPPCTVRQVFYQCSVAGLVEKEESGYRKVQRELLRMRRQGRIPYGWIADNTRWMRKPRTHNGLADALDYVARNYRQSVWASLDDYVEVWCEKDALAGVLLDVTAVYDVPLMVARGYSSETFAQAAAENFIQKIREGKFVAVYYLGVYAGTAENSVTNPDLQPASVLMRSARRPNASFTYSNALGSAPCARREPLKLSRSESHFR